MIEVSIIIPIYNSEKYLSECIESILNQTYKNYELILIDDGSTDHSKDICMNYAKTDTKIKYFFKKNGGVSKARNMGIQIACGQYVCFVDSDDKLKDTYLETLVNGINEADMGVCGWDELHKKNIVEKKISNKNIKFKNDDVYIKLLDATFSNQFNIPWNKLYRRKIIIDNKILFDNNLSLGEDFKFNLDYMKYIDSISIFSSCLYQYRISSIGLTGTYNGNHWELEKYLADYFIKFYKEKNMYEKYKLKLNEIYITAAKKSFSYIMQSSLTKSQKKELIYVIVADVELQKKLNEVLILNRFSRILFKYIKTKKVNWIYNIYSFKNFIRR